MFPVRASALLLLLAGSALAKHKKLYGASAHAPASGASPCDLVIPGDWTGFFPEPLNDLYGLAWSPGPPNWQATALQGGGWGQGDASFGADNLTASISFDTGVKLTGNVSANCSVIEWDNGSVWKAVVTPAAITDVHIIAMNHLDVGYNGIPGLGLINNILNIYFAEYFPRAIAVASALRAWGGPERLIYTTHGFLVSLYINCPENFTLSGITLVCPTPQAVADFTAAVQRGDIVWHAGAFNTEYENAFNDVMVGFQFQPSFDAADALGVPRPRTLSLRDVPGTTRSLIPILVKNNITALSVGVNGGSPAPDMPNPGIWKDPASGASVLYMQTGQGQGYPNNPGPDPVNCGGMCRSSCVTFPGLSHALCWAFRTDNSGPPMDMDEVFQQFDIARWQFPGANVFASSYDNFTAQLITVADSLPVVTGEVGDTWMTSTTADSWKQVFYRESARALTDCMSPGGGCDAHDGRISNFTRLLIKIPEHTYGLPGMSDGANWTNEQFAQVIASGEPAYLDCLHSYTEQRDIAAALGIGYLGDHPLAANISARMAALVPAVPDVSGLTPVAPGSWGAPFTTKVPSGASVTLAFDASTGALARLNLAGVEWADAAHPLALYIYKTYNDTDYDAQGTCCYGESGRQTVANPNRTTTSPTMTGLWVDDAAAPTRAVVSMSMPALQHASYGAPETLWLDVAINGDGSLSLDLQAFNKTPTRLGEAHFFSFLPAPIAGGDYTWLMDILGSWVDPLDTVANGGLHQHGVREGVVYASAASPATAFFAIDTLDAPVVNPATAAQPATMFPQPLTPLDGPVLGFDVQLLQNAFSTNTPLFSWDANYRWRFGIRASQ